MTNKKKHATTIRDIAKLADVSYQTVSLVINGKPGVSDKTRKRIMSLLEEMDYRPNLVAQMLTTNRSNTIQLIIVDVTYGGRLAESTKNMARAAREDGYNLLVADTNFNELPGALENAAARLIDGIVLYAPRLKISDQELMELCHGIPLVRRDYVPGSRIAWVGFDQAYATRLATEHLIGLGHQQIACIPPSSEILNGYWRHTTWKNVLYENGLQPGPSFEGDYSIGSGYHAANQIIATGQPFTAIVVGTDYMAMGALRALREHGIRVPHDVSVVGMDNQEVAAYTDPPLTTVDFRFSKQDELVVKYLLELINDPQMETHQRVLMADLILRESTRPIM
jgi:DNA-binding LacI/PurR family transcriptional regulator